MYTNVCRGFYIGGLCLPGISLPHSEESKYLVNWGIFLSFREIWSRSWYHKKNCVVCSGQGWTEKMWCVEWTEQWCHWMCCCRNYRRLPCQNHSKCLKFPHIFSLENSDWVQICTLVKKIFLKNRVLGAIYEEDSSKINKQVWFCWNMLIEYTHWIPWYESFIWGKRPLQQCTECIVQRFPPRSYRYVEL